MNPSGHIVFLAFEIVHFQVWDSTMSFSIPYTSVIDSQTTLERESCAFGWVCINCFWEGLQPVFWLVQWQIDTRFWRRRHTEKHFLVVLIFCSLLVNCCQGALFLNWHFPAERIAIKGQRPGQRLLRLQVDVDVTLSEHKSSTLFVFTWAALQNSLRSLHSFKLAVIAKFISDGDVSVSIFQLVL